MILTLLSQTIILPSMLAILALWISLKTDRLRQSSIVFWLPCFLWINGFPSLPPQQALEWLPPLVLVLVAIKHIPVLSSIHKTIAAVCVIAGAIVVISYPIVLHYLTLFVLLEIILISIVALGLFVSIEAKNRALGFPFLSFSMACGIGGVATILNASLVVGLSMASLAALLFIIGFANEFLRTRVLMNPSIAGSMVVLLLFVSRMFADLPFITLAPLLLVTVSPLVKMPWQYRWLVIVVLLTSALGYVIYNEVLVPESNGYY